MLSFQAQSIALVVDVAVLAVDAIQKVARIELHSWLCGVNLQHSPGGRSINACRQHQAWALAIDHEIVVISSPKTSCSSLSLIRDPMAVGLVKSNGVPVTLAIFPVGIRVASTGVK